MIFNTQEELEFCMKENHKVIWESKRRWRGVYPRTIKGLCLDCDKNYQKLVDGKEKEVKIDEWKIE